MLGTTRRTNLGTSLALRTVAEVRSFELAQVALWHLGLVPGELHTSIGEEGIAAGVTMHLRDGDAMALDHRGTGPLIARGADPVDLLLDILGSEQGPSRGWAGHMHLAVPDLIAAGDGIVGSSGPIACGFAVAARRRPGAVAVAFFGEGAANQGMLLESLNLAVAWQLPLLFVCKDSGWSITTRTADVTGGRLLDRARAFGLKAERVDGWRTDQVHAVAGKLLGRARRGKGPGFLLARCHRPRGHFEGDPLVDLATHPFSEAPAVLRPVGRGATAATGGTTGGRVRGLTELTSRVVRYLADEAFGRRDPLTVVRDLVEPDVAARVESQAVAEMQGAVRDALARTGIDPVVADQVNAAQELSP